jgi:DNA-binding response OmpR family regulator
MRKSLAPVPVEAALKAVLAPLARRLDGDLVCEIMPGVGTSTYGDPGALAEVVAALVDQVIKDGVRTEVHVRVARQFAGWAPTKNVMVTVLAGEPGMPLRELGHEEIPLPCADEDEASAALAATRVLVVARSARMRRVCTRAAERFGAETSEASDLDMALARLRDHAARGSAFDAVVVDAVVVDAALTRLLERLRSDGSLGTPVTLVATVGAEGERAACVDAGATVALEKPLLPRELRDAIDGARAASGSAALARAAAKITQDPGPFGGAAPRAPMTGVMAKKLRFLVVEDESLKARFAHLAIRRLGHEAVHVGSGRAATDMLERERFDIVLLDLALPELEGFAVARWVRHRERTGIRMPLVALVDKDVERSRISAAGFDAVLAKPVDVSALAEAVRSVVPREDG